MADITTISIRKAVSSDAVVVTEYNVRLARETEGRELARETVGQGVAALLADAERGIYFLAEIGGEVVGQLMITREWSDWRNAWFWWIQSVYVRAESRGQGVYRSLYSHVKSVAAQEDDVCGIRLYVESENERAQEVYRRMGMSKSSYQFFELEF